jgi:hypothetical protein
MSDDYLFYPTFDLGAFRHAAARYVRLLIQSRLACKPGFLQVTELKAWKLEAFKADRSLSASLM